MKAARPSARFDPWLLAAVAIPLRTIGLGRPSLWLDEAFTIVRAAAGEPLAEAIEGIASDDAHPPLYYLLVRIAISFLGDGAVAARLPAALAGIGAVLLFHRLARAFLGRPAALSAGLLYAASPLAVHFAREGRHYALVELLVTGALLAVVRLLEGAEEPPGRERLRWLGLHGTLLALSFYTFYYALFPGLCLGLVSLGLAAAGRRRPTALRLAGTQLAAAAAFGPWVPVVLRRMNQFETLGPETPPPAPLSGTGLLDLLGRLLADAPALGPLALALVGAGAVLLARRHPVRLTAPVLAILVGCPVLVSILPFRLQAFEAKHLIFLGPPVFLAVGALVERLAAGPVPLRLAALLLVASLLALDASRLAGDLTAEKEDWNAAAAALAERVGPTDVVLLDPHYLDTPLRQAADPDPPLSGADPRRAAWRARTAVADRVWLVEVEGNDLARSRGIGREALEGFEREETLEFEGTVGRITIGRYER